MSETTPARTVAVIGGGISGLVAARDLSRRPGIDVVLIEASPLLGGKITTGTIGDVVIEEGPDSFLAREPWAIALCRELELSDELVAPAVFGAYIFGNGRLRRLPPGFPYGIPVAPMAAARSRALSMRGALRALGDLVISGPLEGPDVSVAELVERRFGGETLARLVDPLLAGTRAGRVDELSLAAALPGIDAVARRHRSVIRGLRAGGGDSGGPPPFLGLRGGTERLVDRLRADLEPRVLIFTGTTVEGIERGDRYRVRGPAGHIVDAEAVIVCVPAYAAAGILRTISPDAARELGSIEYASVAVASLIFSSAVRPPFTHGSGILVPDSEDRTLSACTFFTEKWPHTRPPDGRRVVRCFVGRAGRHPALDLDDDELVSRLVTDLEDIAGVQESPHEWKVTRWDRSLPQYRVGHLDRVAAADAALERTPGIAIAGAGYRGSGIPDCIREGRAAARRVVSLLTPGG